MAAQLEQIKNLAEPCPLNDDIPTIHRKGGFLQWNALAMASIMLCHGQMLPLGWSSWAKREVQGPSAELPGHQISDASIGMTTLSFGADPEENRRPAPAPENRRRTLSPAGN